MDEDRYLIQKWNEFVAALMAGLDPADPRGDRAMRIGSAYAAAEPHGWPGAWPWQH